MSIRSLYKDVWGVVFNFLPLEDLIECANVSVELRQFTLPRLPAGGATLSTRLKNQLLLVIAHTIRCLHDKVDDVTIYQLKNSFNRPLPRNINGLPYFQSINCGMRSDNLVALISDMFDELASDHLLYQSRCTTVNFECFKPVEGGTCISSMRCWIRLNESKQSDTAVKTYLLPYYRTSATAPMSCLCEPAIMDDWVLRSVRVRVWKRMSREHYFSNTQTSKYEISAKSVDEPKGTWLLARTCDVCFMQRASLQATDNVTMFTDENASKITTVTTCCDDCFLIATSRASRIHECIMHRLMPYFNGLPLLWRGLFRETASVVTTKRPIKVLKKHALHIAGQSEYPDEYPKDICNLITNILQAEVR